MRFLAIFLLFCNIAQAEELPENFSSLPWTEKTATKWEGKIPPYYEDVYLSEKPAQDETSKFKVYGIQEVLTDKGVAYLVSIDKTEKPTVSKEASYLNAVKIVDPVKELSLEENLIAEL